MVKRFIYFTYECVSGWNECEKEKKYVPADKTLYLQTKVYSFAIF